jgi:hypothetical protein
MCHLGRLRNCHRGKFAVTAKNISGASRPDMSAEVRLSVRVNTVIEGDSYLLIEGSVHALI